MQLETGRQRMGNNTRSAGFTCFLALVAITLASSLAAVAADSVCPNTDAAHSRVEELGAQFSSGTATVGQGDQLIVLDIKLSTAYTKCAST